MLDGLEELLQVTINHLRNLHFILHIPYVAAADYLRPHRNDTADKDNAGLPPMSEHQAPYDWFKRQSEDVKRMDSYHRRHHGDLHMVTYV